MTRQQSTVGQSNIFLCYLSYQGEKMQNLISLKSCEEINDSMSEIGRYYDSTSTWRTVRKQISCSERQHGGREQTIILCQQFRTRSSAFQMVLSVAYIKCSCKCIKVSNLIWNIIPFLLESCKFRIYESNVIVRACLRRHRWVPHTLWVLCFVLFFSFHVSILII